LGGIFQVGDKPFEIC
jgi:threonine dehydratase